MRGAWARYGQAKSGTSLAHEVTAFRAAAAAWRSRSSTAAPDSILDLTVDAEDAGLLSALVARDLAQPGWTLPATVTANLGRLAAWRAGQPTRLQVLASPVAQTASATPAGVSLLAGLPAMGPLADRCAVITRTLPGRVDRFLVGLDQPAAREGRFISLAALGETSTGAVTLVAPSVVDALAVDGYCANHRGDPERAVRVLGAALELNPDRPVIAAELAQALIGSGAYTEALALLEPLLASTAAPCLQAALLKKQGFALLEIGALAEAHAAFHRASALHPADRVAPHERDVVEQLIARMGGSVPPAPAPTSSASCQRTTPLPVAPPR